MSDTAALAERLRATIRDVPDFPHEGIVFKDITTLLGDAAAFRDATDALVDAHRNQPIDAVLGVQSRGFILGAARPYLLGAAFVPVPKAPTAPRPPTPP